MRHLPSILCALLAYLPVHNCAQDVPDAIPLGKPAKSYNLICELPDVLISPQAEQIGATWNNGQVWDKPVINAFYQLLKKKNGHFVVLDVGAQTGCFTLLSKYFPDSEWYAFEPIQEAVDVLNLHLNLNAIRNVSVHQLAISDRKGSALLKLPADHHWGLTTLGAAPLRFHDFQTRPVECIDLDTFLSTYKVDKVDFIKIDTEGWELFVLRGAKAMIARDMPTILLEFNQINMEQCQVHPEDVLKLLEEFGYKHILLSSEDLLCTPKQPT